MACECLSVCLSVNPMTLFPPLQFVVHEVPGQDLEVDLYDEDPDKDDFLGR